ncbi:MAG: hypothetical protein IPJ84_19925 [Bdellovibrionales bacterium]|nr:hypothetical protein [Bdellovibrionales bacterium]
MQNQQAKPPIPVNNGSATELRDRIMGSLIWSEEYYKNQSAGFLMHLMVGLCWLRDNRILKIDIELVVRCLKDIDYIAELAKQIPSDLDRVRMRVEEAHSFLSSNDNFKSLQGLRVQRVDCLFGLR